MRLRPFLRRVRDNTALIASGAADLMACPFVNPGKSIVITGFWRSGTTWLQELAVRATDGKIVFEPFQFEAPYVYRFPPLNSKSPDRDSSLDGTFMPYGTGRLSHGSALQVTCAAALRGRLLHEKVRLHRARELRPSLKPRVVVKFTRASLCLDALAATFPNTIVHVRRDPRAVCASVKNSRPWAPKLFYPLRLAPHLLEIDDGRERFFAPWRASIQAIDQLGPLARVAGYWALTEQAAESAITCHPEQLRLLSYEELLGKDSTEIMELFRGFGWKTPPDPEHLDPARPSASTHERNRQPGHDKPRNWRETLTGEEIQEIDRALELAGYDAATQAFTGPPGQQRRSRRFRSWSPASTPRKRSPAWQNRSAPRRVPSMSGSATMTPVRTTRRRWRNHSVPGFSAAPRTAVPRKRAMNSPVPPATSGFTSTMPMTSWRQISWREPSRSASLVPMPSSSGMIGSKSLPAGNFSALLPAPSRSSKIR